MYNIQFRIDKNKKEIIDISLLQDKKEIEKISFNQDDMIRELIYKGRKEHYDIVYNGSLAIVNFSNQNIDKLNYLVNKCTEYIKDKINELDFLMNNSNCEYQVRSEAYKKKLSFLLSLCLVLSQGVMSIGNDVNSSDINNIQTINFQYENTIEEDNSKIKSEIVEKKFEIGEAYVYENIKEETNNEIEQDISKIQNDSNITFGFNVNDCTDSQAYYDAEENYYDIMKKYAKMYGVDARLLLAMAMQETRGIHSNKVSSGGGLGLAQIQVKGSWNWTGKTLSAYNFETQGVDSFIVTIENAANVDNNIRYMAMILQRCILSMNGNVIQGLQAYNSGPSKVVKCLKSYSSYTGIPYNEIISNQTDLDWTAYMKSGGDPRYVSHVLRFLPDEAVISIKGIPGKTNDCVMKFDNLSKGPVLRR